MHGLGYASPPPPQAKPSKPQASSPAIMRHQYRRPPGQEPAQNGVLPQTAIYNAGQSSSQSGQKPPSQPKVHAAAAARAAEASTPPQGAGVSEQMPILGGRPLDRPVLEGGQGRAQLVLDAAAVIEQTVLQGEGKKAPAGKRPRQTKEAPTNGRLQKAADVLLLIKQGAPYQVPQVAPVNSTTAPPQPACSPAKEAPKPKATRRRRAPPVARSAKQPQPSGVAQAGQQLHDRAARGNAVLANGKSGAAKKRDTSLQLPTPRKANTAPAMPPPKQPPARKKRAKMAAAYCAPEVAAAEPVAAVLQQEVAKGGRGRSRASRSSRANVPSTESNAWATLKAQQKELRPWRSRIAGWGLVANQVIEPNQYVIEYTGELLRNRTADLRERAYERAGWDSCYMFRLDSDRIVDATCKGGMARFINHSCDPNCVPRIVQIEGEKHIVIYSKRRIECREELTYDYKFQFEPDAEAVPCHCGARNCRKRMN
ncbi:hypothetical protein WJX73_003602 [Symbiochloris irregularis]|uniref:[histone H3]-lysine(4) N-trimethyltransferase n=1 Tax=Symbiochloris irregularis TaxID=706552 RepID=A0AAW1PTL6_9CHLO